MAKKLTSRCYASQHLCPQEFGLYEVCQRLTSGGKRTLFFDGRSVAGLFRDTSRSTIYRYRDCLTTNGWLEPLNLLANGRTPRKPNGQNAPTEYHVVSHAEWATKHGTQECNQSRPWDWTSPADETGPVPKAKEASPKIEESQSQNSEKPVPPAGRSFIKESFVKEISVTNTNPSFELGSSNDTPRIPASRNHKAPSQEACRLAAKLKAEICRNKADFRVTPQQELNWAVTAQRMITIDKRAPQEIADLIEWVQRDEFWMSNILSMDKLRKQFDQLQMKVDRRSSKVTGRHASFADMDYTKGTEGFVVAGGGQ